jgi:hypothetical protein
MSVLSTLSLPMLATRPSHAQPVVERRTCVSVADPRVRDLLSAFPGGGPGLRAGVARLLETVPSLATTLASAAVHANQQQKVAIGAGMLDAARFFNGCGTATCLLLEREVRVALTRCTDKDTQVGAVVSDSAGLLQTLSGINVVGATTGGCRPVVSQSQPGC